MKTIYLFLMACAILLTQVSCKKEKAQFDASGTFEADEIMVSAEQSGKIIALNIEEGQTLPADTIIGAIDVTGLQVQKEQTKAAVNAIKNKTNQAAPQIAVLESQIATQKAQIATLNQQLAVLEKEIRRTQNLVNADAVPRKQLDDLNGQQAVLQKQIAAAQEQIKVLNTQISAAKDNVSLQNRGILSEIEPTEKKIAVIDEQIGRGLIKNPHAGTVLAQYARSGEFATLGKALYKIADLSTITLRAYISGSQLPTVRLHQKVEVLTDDGNGGYKSTEGIITWISSKAEFTPKTIQTKEERANLVYAVKIAVKNDGYYKIGMYGEIKLKQE
ncbi:MAG: efflux RND transporter periplasmic adaptor subunit [Sphingobacteriales bacterium]|nr:efflux RND transporter periplasmic adaptor subunit [Sphingobacteriales bacterium]